MTKKRPKSKHTDDLRKRAEKRIPEPMDSIRETSEIEVKKLIHELQVHQVELEMQNEALRKSQMETAESQYKYSDLFNFAPVGYFTLDRRGHIIEANVTGASLLGAEKRPLAKQPFQRFIVPGHLSLFQSHLQKAHDSRSKQTCKLKLTGRDGTPFDALIDTIAVIDGEGEFDHYRSSVTDITEITKAVEALRESEENFRRSMDDSPLGVRIVTIEGETIYANRVILDIYGYDSLEELRTTPLRKRYTPESYAEFQIRREKRKRGDYSQSEYEISIVRKNGEVRHLHVFRKEVFWDGEGQFQVLYNDTTERKRAEEALHESETKILEALHFNKTILNTSSIGILTYKESGQCTYANDAAAKIVGTNVAGLLEQNFHQIQSWKKSGMFEVAMKALRTGIEQRIEPLVTTFGKDVWLSIMFSSFYSEGKNHLLVFMYDITEPKRAEEAIKASHHQLRAFAGRLQSVREEQRKEFAREIHDELGGALTGLKIDLSFLASSAPKRRDKTKRDSFLSKMLDMTKLIDETIGTVRRLVTELRPSILDDFGLFAALEWQLQEFQKRTGIQSEFVSSMEYINLDEELSIAVFRIFQEALTNVARHANATKVTATLYKEADSLVLKVEDNGRGISADDIHNTKSIGLIGMRERALFLGGKINFSREPSKGTTVSVRFPYKEPSPQA